MLIRSDEPLGKIARSATVPLDHGGNLIRGVDYFVADLLLAEQRVQDEEDESWRSMDEPRATRNHRAARCQLDSDVDSS